MHLPKTIIMGRDRIPVIYSDFPFPASGAILNATESQPRRIWIRQNGDERHAQETLLHEIIHLVDKEMCMRHSGMTEFEESYVEEFSTILFDTLYNSGLWNTTPDSNMHQTEMNFD